MKKLQMRFSRWSTFSASLIFFLCCCSRPDSNKENVEKQNKERFARSTEKREAQFVVNAIDQSYAVLDLAELGDQRGASPQVRYQVQRITTLYTTIMNKLKVYAEDNSISVPLEGPESTGSGVEALYTEKGKTFDRKWCQMVIKYNRKMIDDFRRHSDDVDTTLLRVIHTSLPALWEHQSLLENYLAENR